MNMVEMSNNYIIVEINQIACLYPHLYISLQVSSMDVLERLSKHRFVYDLRVLDD